jgi:hypothetical protein
MEYTEGRMSKARASHPPRKCNVNLVRDLGRETMKKQSRHQTDDGVRNSTGHYNKIRLAWFRKIG